MDRQTKIYRQAGIQTDGRINRRTDRQAGRKKEQTERWRNTKYRQTD
jgi:hypothetical protein